MGKYHIPGWLQAAIATSGGLGLFLLAFLDASILPFPSLNDLILIDLCLQFPARMPYYAAMSTVGSAAGCLLLYYIGRKGEEAAFHIKPGAQAPKARKWLERNGFISMFGAAILPPPMPLKVFVLAAGALGMPVRQFTAAVLLARAIRFYGIGYLAVHYGPPTAAYLLAHRVAFLVVSVIVLAVCYVIYLLFRMRRQQA